MYKHSILPVTLIAAAILSGCGSIPPNASLAEAHSHYDSARANPQVNNLAAVELKEAQDSLSAADYASSKRKDTATVNQLAYVAKQKVAIAQEVAQRKADEIAVTNATAKRDQMRLEARTAEADAAKKQVGIAQATADQQAAALAAAGVNATRNQERLDAKTAEANTAKQQAAMAQATAEQQTAALAALNATRNQERLDAATAEANAAKQQVAMAQATAEQQTAALAAAGANATRNQARLDAQTAEIEAAKREAALSQSAAEQHAAALAAVSAGAARDQGRMARQEAQLAELSAKKTERGMVITLGDVLFSSNKAELKSGGVRNVQKLADFLKQYPEYKVLIEGHTDSVGSDSFNQALSERRANAVRAAFHNTRIDSSRVTTHGYGEEFPVASNDTADSRQLNRRVEIILSDNDGNIAPR